MKLAWMLALLFGLAQTETAVDPAQSGKNFADSLKKLRGQAPAAPKVSLLLRITNHAVNKALMMAPATESRSMILGAARST